MSLDFTKVTYVDGETVIGADNLNDIQDALLDLDDNKVEKEQGKGLSENDYTDTDKLKVDNAYVVPDGGIPKSALASAVQTSLGKADTALQEDNLEPYRTAEEQDEIDNAIEDRASVPNTVGPSAVVTFESSFADAPLKQLTVNIEPVQSGTGDPSPTNVRPISGWTGCNVMRTGKNLFDKTGPIIDNSYIDNNGTIAASSGRAVCYIPCVPNTKYTISRLRVVENERMSAGYTTVIPAIGVTVSGVLSAASAGSIDDPIAITITTGADAKYLAVWVYWGSATTALDSLQIELGSTATAYEPYTGTTYPITFPTSAGTVYGGTLDVTNGVLTVDRGYKRYVGDVSEGWEARSYSGYYRYNVLVPNSVYPPSTKLTEGVAANWLRTASTGDRNYTIYMIRRVGFNNGVFDVLLPLDNRFSNTTSLREYLAENPLDTIYPLAQPITYQLTPQEVTTLLGANNIWADCGDVTVTYGAYLKDIKDYADQVDSGILSAVAPLEETYTASRNYAVGSYLFVGTKFYKVTSAIQTGGTINPGTNVDQTTVAEQLMTLAVKPAILG